MGFARFRSTFRRSSTQEIVTPTTVNADEETKRDLATETVIPANASDENPEAPTEDTQRGVRDVEAITLSWSKTMLIAVFVK